jgi:AcrR family transcriptional regulator
MSADAGFESRREEIRTVALHVFATQGFASATMRDVAMETGILAGSLYHYFGSKDEVLVDGLVRYYNDSIRDLRAILAKNVPPADMLAELITLGVKYLVERRDETTILHNDFDYLRQLPPFKFVITSAAEVEQCWEQAIERGIEDGSFKKEIGATLTYRAIVGAIFSTARWYDPEGPIDVPEFSRQLASTFLDGLITA